VLDLGQASAATQTIAFTGDSGLLSVGQPSAFQSPIIGFETGDVVDFAGLTATAALYSGGDLTLYDGTTPVAQATVSTPYAGNVFSVASDGSGGTDVTVTQPPPVAPDDFASNDISDILWQNTDGQAAVWLERDEVWLNR
jgi:hypothetical protein